MLQQTCVVVRRSESDTDFNEYGDPEIIEDESNTIPCALQKLQRDEREEEPDEGEFAKALYRLFLPVGTEIDTTDYVIIDGEKYEAISEPNVRNSLTNRWGFVEMTMVLVGTVPDSGS